MNVVAFEEHLWKRDGVRIVIRAPTWTEVQKPAQTNAASETMSVTAYIGARVQGSIGKSECVAIDGYGKIVHGRTKIGTLRATYRT
jgi:hypothetical protein